MAIFNLGSRKANQEVMGQQFPNSRIPAAGTELEQGQGYHGGPSQAGMKSEQERERYVQDLNTQVGRQAERFMQKYPAFHMEEELKNPTFRYYVWSMGLSVEEAYLLTHKDEILEQLQQSQEPKLSARIPENGTGRVYPAATRPNFEEMSDEELDEIAARVQKGERIAFE